MSTSQEPLTRREFLGALGAGTLFGSAISSLTTVEEAEPPEEQEAGIPRVTLGRTKRKVARLGIGGSWNVHLPLVLQAFKLGVNYIDTSENYGKSESVYGQAIEKFGRRKDLFLVTKTGQPDPAALEQHLRGSLERLRTDYVDAYFLHGLSSPATLQEPALKEGVERLKQSGKAHFFGFSCHHQRLPEVLEAAAACGFVDVIMLKYNFRDCDSDALNRALDKCSEAKIGLAAMKTQAGGPTKPEVFEPFQQRGFNPHQAALKAVWADQRLHVAVSEMTTFEQLAQNTAAAREPLTEEEAAALRSYARATDHLYCRGCDHLCGGACGQKVAVSDVLRCLMYHDYYGQPERARAAFAVLPAAARDLAGADWEAAARACPHGLPLARWMARASEVLG